MMAKFFEGTRPINEIDADAGVSFEIDEEGNAIEDEGAPVPQVPLRRGAQKKPAQARRPMNEVWKELAGVKKQGAAPAPGGPIPIDPGVEAERLKMEEARLKRVRESLERPA
jgi:hypothetical protein